MNMKKHTLWITIALLCGTLPVLAQTYGTDNHTVTVQVSTITSVSVTVGSLAMTITGAGVPAGQDQMTVVNTASTLRWGINSSTRKITARSNLTAGAQNFTLRLLAVSPTQGTAAPEVTLTTTARDLMLNVGRSLGTSTLQYTGVALASEGTGTDSHTITFTVTNQ